MDAHRLPASRFLFVLLPGAGGVALVAHILVGLSLNVGILALFAGSAGLWLATWRLAAPEVRCALRTRIVAGLKAGLLGTVAYDVCRYGVVALLAFSFEPFHVLSIFGRLLVGENVSAEAAFAAGATFHLFNGLGFAVAFALIIPRPSWKLGILWGIGLELAMAALYPSWLRIAALQEFLTVSALGHVVYGAVMGATAQRLLNPGPRSLLHAERRAP